MDNYYTLYKLTDPIPGIPYEDGDGIFINLTGSFKWFDMMISYWHGNEYYSPNGGRLYRSVSWDYPVTGYTEEQRDLLFFRLMYERELTTGLTLAFRFEPMYDMKNQLMEHSESIYLRYNIDFLLNKKANH